MRSVTMISAETNGEKSSFFKKKQGISRYEAMRLAMGARYAVFECAPAPNARSSSRLIGIQKQAWACVAEYRTRFSNAKPKGES